MFIRCKFLCRFQFLQWLTLTWPTDILPCLVFDLNMIHWPTFLFVLWPWLDPLTFHICYLTLTRLTDLLLYFFFDLDLITNLLFLVLWPWFDPLTYFHDCSIITAFCVNWEMSSFKALRCMSVYYFCAIFCFKNDSRLIIHYNCCKQFY